MKSGTIDDDETTTLFYRVGDNEDEDRQIFSFPVDPFDTTTRLQMFGKGS